MRGVRRKPRTRIPWLLHLTADVLLQAGVVAALPYLKRLAAGGKRARPEAIAVAERMVDAWPDDAGRWDYSMDRAGPESADRIEMSAALTRLKEPALLDRFLSEKVASSYDGSENTALLASLTVLADAQAAAVLSNLMSARMPEYPNECTELLLARGTNPSLRFPEVAEAAVAGLDTIGACDSESKDFPWELEEQRPLGPRFLVNLLRALQSFQGGTLCTAAARKIASHPEIFNPVTLVVPAAERICASRRKTTTALDDSVRHLWTSAAEFLLLRSETPPRPPADWRLVVELSCSCPDCAELRCEGFGHRLLSSDVPLQDMVNFESEEPMRSRRRIAALLRTGGHSAENAREALAQAFLKRSVKMLERVSSSASSEALKSALSSPTDLGGVATLLSDLAPLDVDVSSVDPFVEAMARGAAIKQELLTSAGGGLTSSQVASALDITRQAVDKRRGRHALLAVPNGSGEYLYPACQFTSTGVIPGLEEVLRAFQIRSPWTQLSALLAPAPALGGKTILEALKAGATERAIAIAASFGEQAA